MVSRYIEIHARAVYYSNYYTTPNGEAMVVVIARTGTDHCLAAMLEGYTNLANIFTKNLFENYLFREPTHFDQNGQKLCDSAPCIRAFPCYARINSTRSQAI